MNSYSQRNVSHPRYRKRGFALVLVLSILALLIVLVMGFFSSVTSETVSSGHYAAAANARRLADSGLGMVTSQIRLASSGSTGKMTWTSQPGLLRTFDSNGAASEVFKLYSAATLRSAANAYNEDDDGVTNWKASQWYKALYADINQPVVAASGALVYPIVDPKAGQADANTGRKAVSGFQLGSAPGYDSGHGSADAPENNPAAMPVRWLYVLQDGQIGVPESVDENGNVAFSSANAIPSRANPVVGRVAFWTDDETCKLNINTAGYGVNTDTYWTYWDTPVCYSTDEENYLSKNQPWKGEYQRYPGHPATTSLHTVLPELAKFDLFKITPYFRADATTRGAGSDGGTVDSNGSTPLALKQDRLYASVDELLYDPARNANLPSLTNVEMDGKRFFLTAHSRAPDLNLFGQPRVTIWPQWDLPANRTALDKLIAFCASTSKEQFYFVRHDPISNAELSLGSNPQLYAYLQKMTGRPIPGFGGPPDNLGFSSPTKYGKDRDQILTSIFDTIRITNLAEKPPAVPYTSSNHVMGQVVPTDGPGNTRGAGRIVCIKEADLVFTNLATASGTSSVALGILFDFWQPAAGAVAGGADFTYEVEGLESLTISGTATGSGTTMLFSGSNYVSGISSYVSGTSYNPEGNPVITSSYTHGTREYRFSAVYGGANPQLSAISGTAMTGEGSSGSCTFDQPLTSDVIQLTGGSFKFNGGTITVTIQAPKDSGNTIQKYTFSFPAINSVPVPSIPNPATELWNNTTGRWRALQSGAKVVHQNDIVKALQLTGSTSSGFPINGDIRLLAQSNTIPSSMFAPAKNYQNTSRGGQHGLRIPGGLTVVYGTCGHLIQNFVPDFDAMWPDIPHGVDGVKTASGFPGDWDNGYGFLADGPYLPKPDEGVIYSNSSSNAAERGYFYPTLIDKAMYEGNLQTLFSANRQVPSAGIFGNTPTGVLRGLPWQTLLFRPVHDYLPFGGPIQNHPGAASPPDHLLLDLFEMPVVEPYAISEPFSTAGKVNMNYRIKPFQYIHRDTAVRAVLESVKMTAIPEDAFTSGYRGYAPYPAYPNPTRYNINSAETLKQFDQRFDSTVGKPVFVSETEICNLDLVPVTSSGAISLSNLKSFWSNKRTTGDNSLERPYALLYPRLTTKSNTYTVYVLAQSLKTPGAYQNGWNERAGALVGEWRGEYTIERYVDPKNPDMPKFLENADGDLSKLYKFRTLNVKRFDP